MMFNLYFLFKPWIIVYALLGFIGFLFFISLIRALFLKYKKARTVNLNGADKELTNLYGDKLFEMISIQTSSYEDNEVYHIFREKIKQLFPLVHLKFKKEKAGSNIIFTYRGNNLTNNVLVVTHIDSSTIEKKLKITDEKLYGSGTFDSKSLFFVVMQAVEEYLQFYKQFEFNLTIVMTVDDESTNAGNEKIVDMFLRQGKFFNLVIEEGIGIIDPTFLQMKSNYALLGIGVTGEAKIRYQISKNRGAKDLEDFVRNVKIDRIFKSEIDKNSKRILYEFSKDMPFLKRLMFSNIWLYRSIVKRYINNNDAFRLARLMRTYIEYGAIQETESIYYVDFIYKMASHDTTAEIIDLIDPYVYKYNIAFEILDSKEPSKVTSIKHAGYKIVEKTIKETYDNVYISPYIITKISDQRNLARVSDCVIRYSPLYYTNEMLNDAAKGNEQIMKKSLYYGVKFYKNLFTECDNKVRSLKNK
ncbi:MAG: M20/M25/M40 family metallo-hydrolase [Bacilli bacterium]